MKLPELRKITIVALTREQLREAEGGVRRSRNHTCDRTCPVCAGTTGDTEQDTLGACQ
jgi:hypothetical protein